jgi:thiol:disulfide interchange protein DsbA
MKRRTFVLTAASAAAPASLFGSPAARAQGGGTSYFVLKTPVPVDVRTGHIEVLEFFSYGCNHCQTVVPRLAAWAKKLPSDVVVRLVHVGWSANMKTLQRLYYALDAMDIAGEMQDKVFNVLHSEVPMTKLYEQDVLFAWIARQGIDLDKFEQIFNSSAMKWKAERVTQIATAYQLEDVPRLAIGGRFVVGMERGFEVMLNSADELIRKVRESS